MSDLNTEQIKRLQQEIDKNKKVTKINAFIDYSILILLTFLNEYWKDYQEDDQNDAWDFDCKPDKIIITINNVKNKTPFQSIYDKLLKTVRIRKYIDFLRNNNYLIVENVIDEIVSQDTNKSIIIGNRIGPVLNILNQANNDHLQYLKTNLFKNFKVENKYNTSNSRVPNFVKLTFYKYPPNSEGDVIKDIIQYADELNQIRDDLNQNPNREYIKDKVKEAKEQLEQDYCNWFSLSLFQSGDKEINKTVDDVFIPLDLKEKKIDESDQSEEYQALKKNQFFPISYQTFLDDKLEKGNTEKSIGERVAIVGEPGAGKSTLVQYTAYRLLKEDRFEFDIPIVIFLKQLTDFNADNPIKHKIDQIFHQTNIINEVKNQSKVKLWLFLDGVDEVNSQRDILSNLSDWVNELPFPNIKVILNCRINTWVVDLNHPLQDFDTFYTSEFTPDQVKQFIDESWFRKEPEKANELKEQLFENFQHRRLRDLVKNPLMLTMLCAIWEELQTQSEGLPNTQFELYRKYIRFYKKWNDSKGSSNQVSEQEFNDLTQFLGVLGRNALDRNETNLSPYQIREMEIEKAKDELNQKLEASYSIDQLKKLALNLGLLEKKQQGPSEEDSYFFFHPTFQEFFAAWVIDDWDFFLPRYHINYPVKDESGEYKPYRVFDPQWKQVILFWVGRRDTLDQRQQEQEQQDFIFHLENFEEGCGSFNFYRIRGHCLIAACIPELSDYNWTLPDNSEVLWAQDFVEYIIRLAVVEDIHQAGEVLKETDLYLAIPILIFYLQNEEGLVRSSAAQALYGTTDPNAIQSLISCFQDEKGLVRSSAAHALYGTTDPNAIQALIACLQDENESVRSSAAEALSGTTDPETISALTSCFEDEHPKVQLSVARALQGTTDPNAIQALISYLQDENPEVRNLATRALYGTTDPNAIQALIACLQDENESVRFFATQALYGTTDPNAIQALIACLQDEEELVRISAAGALKGTTDPNAIQALIACLQDEQESVRSSAAHALYGTTDPNAIQALIACLQDEKGLVRSLATQVLYGTTDPNAIQALIACLQDEEVLVRTSAAEALSGTTDPETISALTSFLKDEDGIVRASVARALQNTTKKLSYPRFYQIWHGENTTPKSESLNLAQLPTLLNHAIHEANLPQEVKVISIDGNQFTDSENPSLDIYDAMIEAGCPERKDDPDTFTKLKRYWNTLRRDADFPKPVLVFYQNPNFRYQVFSQTFLDKLSRFQGLICLVTEQEQPFPLQTFSPQQPELHQAIVAWIRGTLLEN